jgi:peptidoglycan/LPS O-acetylase OafA/YrhL
LRCLAIVGVVAYHVDGLHSGLVRRGFLGVTLFFAISGFLITTLLLREREESGQISLAHFYARRALRIFPLYYAVLLGYVALTIAFEKTPEVKARFFENLPYFLTYTSNWFVPPSGDTRLIFYFAWSLATEEQFYLLWPVVVRFGHRRGAVLFMTGLLTISLLARWAMGTERLEAPLPLRILASPSPAICLGCLAAYALRSPTGFGVLDHFLGPRWAPPLLLLLVLVAVASERTPMLVLWPLMAALVVACCVSRQHLLMPLLTCGPVRYVGIISYGIYLMHMLVLGGMRRALPGQDFWVQFPLTLALTVAIAGLSHRYFEGWFLRLKHRLSVDAASPTPELRPSAHPSS